MAVPNIFATATTTIPLSQLDANFATAITLGNTAIYLGNTTTSIGNLTLTNATISSVSTAVTVAQGGTGLTSGTSGGVPYFSATTTMASSAALAANALMIGGGAGAAPATTTTGTGVLTALGVNTGTAGAFVVNGGALGTPSSGTVTNLTGTASINTNGAHNGTVGATTPNTGAFTTGSFSGAVSFAAGTVSAPSIYLSTDTGTGFYRIGANNYGFAVSGSKVLDIASTGLAITGALSATSTFASGGTTIDADVDNFQSNSSSATKFTGRFKNTSATTPNGFSVLYSAADPNGTGSEFLYFVGGGTNLRASIRSNGGLANYSANNVNLSDMTIKTDFNAYDAGTLWSFGKRMKAAWGRFKYDDQTHNDWNNGYGAQLVREAAGDDFPELVESVDWDGNGNILTVYDNDLMHIMGAITTEAQYRIEEQEARIARLEAALANAGIAVQ